MIDEIVISRAITQSFITDFMDYMEVDVAIAGAGPSGMVAAYYLAKAGVKTAIFERALRVGGGMPGGGMMFNRIVVQDEAKFILDEMGIRTTKYQEGYFVADSLETICTLCSKAIQAGAKIFNAISVEDVMVRENDRITGLVLNWSAVEAANMHVDPLTIRAKAVIDATGHPSEIARIVARKMGPKLNTRNGEVIGEKSMWAEVGEKALIENTREIFPGLFVTGMAANAVYGSHRMGAIFGGMFLSGKKAAELIVANLAQKEVQKQVP
ncbi:MAG: sulfide-dependent adenosine diphosphate thiazole synthase [Dehalococcoidia bacterium]|nr:sulfide-dependent adenosine diphosphate thiazole synthase [Dehalococcoidia bacterium]